MTVRENNSGAVVSDAMQYRSQGNRRRHRGGHSAFTKPQESARSGEVRVTQMKPEQRVQYQPSNVPTCHKALDILKQMQLDGVDFKVGKKGCIYDDSMGARIGVWVMGHKKGICVASNEDGVEALSMFASRMPEAWNITKHNECFYTAVRK